MARRGHGRERGGEAGVRSHLLRCARVWRRRAVRPRGAPCPGPQRRARARLAAVVSASVEASFSKGYWSPPDASARTSRVAGTILAMTSLRIALCQLDADRRRPRRQCREGDRRFWPRPKRRARSSRSSQSSCSPATRPRTCSWSRALWRAICSRSRRSRQRASVARPSLALSKRTVTSTTPRRSARRAACAALSASNCCRTTGSSTSGGISLPGEEPGPSLLRRGRACRRHDLRGRLEPDRARSAVSAKGEPSSSSRFNASPYRAGILAQRERMLATRAADARPRSVLRQPRRRPGRARLRRRLHGLRPRWRARRRRPRSSARPSSSATSRSTPCSASASWTRGVTKRISALPLVDISAPAENSRAPRQARRDEPGPPSSPRLDRVGEVYEALEARHARLRREEPVHRRARRPLRRGRLLARGHDRGRRARARTCPRGADAVPVLLGRLARGRRRAGRRTSASGRSRCRIEAASPGASRDCSSRCRSPGIPQPVWPGRTSRRASAASS